MAKNTDYPSPVKPPLWVRVVYRFLEWTDNHPIYLAPSSARYSRYRLWDDYCLCGRCEERRREGNQGPYRGRRK